MVCFFSNLQTMDSKNNISFGVSMSNQIFKWLIRGDSGNDGGNGGQGRDDGDGGQEKKVGHAGISHDDKPEFTVRHALKAVACPGCHVELRCARPTCKLIRDLDEH